MDVFEDDYLEHYGMPKRSGRYPYGSGDDPYQHSGDFLARVETLKKQGLTDTEIARSMGLTTTQFRTQKSFSYPVHADLAHKLYELLHIYLCSICHP